MPIAVVDELEPIEVEQYQTYRPVFAAGSANLGFCVLIDRIVVEQTCQGIAPGGLAELIPRLGQARFEVEDPLADRHARQQRTVIKGLGQVVVGPGRQALGDIFFGVVAGEQNEVCVAGQIRGANPLDQLGAVPVGHHPIGDDQLDLLPLEHIPGGLAVVGVQHIIATLGEAKLQAAAHKTIVVCD